MQADTVRTLSEGEGQLVAVLASGIDVNNAQFAPGQVTAGHDALGGGDPHADCDGRGTFAAGLVGAQPQSSTTFAGLAPGVRLDPIRVAQTFDNADNTAADPGRAGDRGHGGDRRPRHGDPGGRTRSDEFAGPAGRGGERRGS